MQLEFAMHALKIASPSPPRAQNISPSPRRMPPLCTHPILMQQPPRSAAFVDGVLGFWMR
jgi:hypothetical protein